MQRAPVSREKREPIQVDVLEMRTQVSPSAKVFTRAEVPENEPVRVHSPSTVQSTQPSEKISSERRAVIW